MAKKFLTNIDLALNELLNVRLQNLAADPTGAEGRIYFNTTNNEARLFAGGAWAPFGSGITAADVLALLLTVDGTGSGLDADTLDGLEATAFAASVHNHLAADITDFNTAVQAVVDTLVDSAPGALDTLNELAAALNDDPNFATTITNLVNGKVDSFNFVTATTSASQVVAHNLASLDCVVSIIESATGEAVMADVVRDSANQVTVTFNPAPTANQYEIIVHA